MINSGKGIIEELKERTKEQQLRLDELSTQLMDLLRYTNQKIQESHAILEA